MSSVALFVPGDVGPSVIGISTDSPGCSDVGWKATANASAVSPVSKAWVMVTAGAPAVPELVSFSVLVFCVPASVEPKPMSSASGSSSETSGKRDSPSRSTT